MTASRVKTFIFHPIFVLCLSLLAALLFVAFAIWKYEGEWWDLLVFYFAPIGMPFVAFLFDRAQHRDKIRWWIDGPVVGLALLRSAYPIPIVSGHSLFLTYALLTSRSWVARLTAFIVLLQVIYLKTFVWHDATLIGGIIVGVLVAWAIHRMNLSHAKSD